MEEAQRLPEHYKPLSWTFEQRKNLPACPWPSLLGASHASSPSPGLRISLLWACLHCLPQKLERRAQSHGSARSHPDLSLWQARCLLQGRNQPAVGFPALPTLPFLPLSSLPGAVSLTDRCLIPACQAPGNASSTAHQFAGFALKRTVRS